MPIPLVVSLFVNSTYQLPYSFLSSVACTLSQSLLLLTSSFKNRLLIESLIGMLVGGLPYCLPNTGTVGLLNGSLISLIIYMDVS